MVNHNKKGAASIYVVAVTALLFAVIVIGFVRIISSESTKTSEDIISQSAYDAALAGVEDAKIALANYYNCLGYKTDNKTSEYETNRCDAVIGYIESSMLEADTVFTEEHCDGVVKALERNGKGADDAPLGGEVLVKESYADRNDTTTQAYTCLTLASTLSDYRSYLNDTNSARLVPIAIDTENDTYSLEDVKSIRLRWYNAENAKTSGLAQSNDASKTLNYLKPSSDTGISFKSAAGNPTPTPPVLSVQFFQFPEGGIDLWSSDDTINSNSNKGEIWLVPRDPSELSATNAINSGTNVFALSNNHTDGVRNEAYTVTCDATFHEDFSCSAIIALPSPADADGNSAPRLLTSKGGAAFLIVSLPYGDYTSDFSVEICKTTSCEGEDILNFQNVQIAVDATGRANDFYRRVETRLELRDLSFPISTNALTLGESSGNSLSKNFWATHNCWYVESGEIGECKDSGIDTVHSNDKITYTLNYDLACPSGATCSGSFASQTKQKSIQAKPEDNYAEFTIYSKSPSSEYEFLGWVDDAGNTYLPNNTIKLSRPAGSSDKIIEATLHASWGTKKYYAHIDVGSGTFINATKIGPDGDSIPVVSGSTVLHDGDRVEISYGSNSAGSSCAISYDFSVKNSSDATLESRSVSDDSGHNTSTTVSASDIYIRTSDLSTREFVITYDGNGATSGSMSQQYVPCGAITTELKDNSPGTGDGYEKENYIFDGWYTTRDGILHDGANAYAESPYRTYSITSDMTFYAGWTTDEKLLTITDNGTETTVKKRIYRDDSGGCVDTDDLTDPNRCKDAESGTEHSDPVLNSGTRLQADDTITFSVKVNDCYDPASMSTIITNSGDPIIANATGREIPSYSVDKNGNTVLDGSTILYTLSGSYSVKNTDSEIKLSSSATKIRYDVTYDGNGGAMVSGSTTSGAKKICGETYRISENSWFSRSGYVFAGFWKDEKSGKIYYPGDEYTANEPLVLKAQWKQLFVIQFDGNGGTGSVNNITVAEGDTFTFPANGFSLEGYNFVGWSTVKTDIAGAIKAGAKSSPVNKSTTYYAVWKKKGPEISGCNFKIYYGTGSSIQSETVSKSSGTYTIDNSRHWTIVFTEPCTASVADFGNVDIYLLGGGTGGVGTLWGGAGAASSGGYGGKRLTKTNLSLSNGSYGIKIGGVNADSSFGSHTSSASGYKQSAGGSVVCQCAYVDSESQNTCGNWGASIDESSPGGGGYAFDDEANGIGVSGSAKTKYGGGGGSGNCVVQGGRGEVTSRQSSVGGGGAGCYRASPAGVNNGAENAREHYGAGGGGACIGAWDAWSPGAFSGIGGTNGWAGYIDGAGSGSSGFVAIRNTRSGGTDPTPPTPVKKDLSTITYMQDITSEICANTPVADTSGNNQYILKDKRDNKSYYVAHLADGNCWMTQNLDYDILTIPDPSNPAFYIRPDSTTSDINEAIHNTNVSSDGVIYASVSRTKDITNNYTNTGNSLPFITDYWGTWSAGDEPWNNPKSADIGDIYWTGINQGTDCNYLSISCPSFSLTPPSNYGSHYHVGNYYNWPAAVAINFSTSVTITDRIMPNSICPKNWQLPNYTGERSFDSLSKAYGNTGAKMQQAPVYMAYAGDIVYDRYNRATLTFANFRGTYWANQIINNSARSYTLSKEVTGIGGSGRMMGISVRCVAR